MEENICGCRIQEDIVEKVAKVMPDEAVLYDLSLIHISEPTRP